MQRRLLMFVVLIAGGLCQALQSPPHATPPAAHLTIPNTKIFKIDDLPKGIKEKRPTALTIRTSFPGVIKFVDADDDFEVEILVSGSQNITRKLQDIVSYNLTRTKTTDSSQAMTLTLLEVPEVSPLSTLMKKIGISVGLACAVVLIIAVIAVTFYARKRRQQANDKERDTPTVDPSGGAVEEASDEVPSTSQGPLWLKQSISDRTVLPSQLKQKMSKNDESQATGKVEVHKDGQDKENKKKAKPKKKGEVDNSTVGPEDGEEKPKKGKTKKKETESNKDKGKKNTNTGSNVDESKTEASTKAVSAEAASTEPGVSSSGGFGKKKKFNLSVITVLGCLCLVAPVAYSLTSSAVTVDVTVHVPRNFLKSDIKVFFLRRTKGQINLSGWKHKVAVEEYDVDSIVVNEESQAFSNCTEMNCEHSCDQATGSCVCRRGFMPNGTQCDDVDECQDGSHDCDVSATCHNTQGSYTCHCVDGYYGDGFTCSLCNATCPPGSYEEKPCDAKSGKICRACKKSCQTGLFISKECDNFTDIECHLCRSSCKVWQYESVPCGGTTDRECRDLTELFPIQVSDNVLVENLRNVKWAKTQDYDASNGKALTGTTVTLDRGTGFTVELTLEHVNLLPPFESVNHSAGNDLDLTPPLQQKYCAYPLPDHYTLNFSIHQEITTLSKQNSKTGIFYGSAREPCQTDFNLTVGTPLNASVNDLACAGPSELSDLFNISDALRAYLSFRVDQDESCYKMNLSCVNCSVECAKSFDNTTKTHEACRIPSNMKKLDQAESQALAARMLDCLRCCILGKCHDCEQYEEQCTEQIRCRTGNVSVYHLHPVFTNNVTCHVKPKSGSLLYRLKYGVFQDGVLVKNKTFISERYVNDKMPTREADRENFLLVKHPTGLSRLPQFVKSFSVPQFEAGENTYSTLIANSDIVKIVSRQPFAFNTQTWRTQSCDMSMDSQLVGPGKWEKWDEISVKWDADGFAIRNKLSSPRIQIVLPDVSRILQPFYNLTSLTNDGSLRAELLRNSSFWIIRISGKVNPCPGLLHVKIRAPEYDNVTMFIYDVGVDCPENFSMEFLLPTKGPDIHEKRMLVEIRDNYRSINLTLFRPPGSKQYNFGQARKIEFKLSGFLLSLVPFMIGSGAMLLALFAILIYGFCTRPDPFHRGRDNRLHKRHLLFIVWFVTFKFAYSLLVTVTEFTLVVRAIHSSTLTVIEQYPDYHRLVATYETIELNKIKTHLDKELARQEGVAVEVKRVCEAQLYTVQKQVQEAREDLLKVYYDVTRKLDIPDLAFKRISIVLNEYAEKLNTTRDDFNRFARDKARKLIQDVKQVYRDVENNSWLAAARALHKTIYTLCFFCGKKPGFMEWVGLDLDLKQFETPDFDVDFPNLNFTFFKLPSIPKPDLPKRQTPNLNLIKNFKNASLDVGLTVDPKYFTKYVPNPEFNFFLDLLQENTLLIILLVLDGLWFAFRMSNTYANVVQRLHGFPYVIDVQAEAEKVEEKNEIEMSRGEKARAAIESGAAKLSDLLLDLCLKLFEVLKIAFQKITDSDLVPQLLLVTFLIMLIYLVVIITENMMDVETLWNLGYFHLKVAPIVANRKFANTRIKANAFKINQLEYPFYEKMVNLRMKQYKTLLKTYNRLMCEHTSFQAVEYCAWWDELYPNEKCKPPQMKPIQLEFTACELPPLDPITYTDFDSLAYRLELKRSMEPFIAALQTTILNSFVAFGVLVIVMVLIGALGQAMTVLLKRFDMVRLLKLYRIYEDPAMTKEYLPACLQERKEERSDIGAVEINTELFGERKHKAPARYIQHHTLLA